MTAKWVGKFPIFWIWLATCAVLILVSWSQIASGIGWGPDDQLRQLQMRDWLSGQSWFDTTQYRIGEPDSQPMHWSRLVELPLALVFLALKPLLGSAMAETAAMVIIPLGALGIAMLLIAKITNSLFSRPVALLAGALTATAVPLVMQLRPMRIDHHGWQIILALFALWTMVWPDKKRAGIALGFSLAIWLSISLEGLPLSIAFIALLVWRWITALDEGIRLFWTLGGFLVGSALLYLLNHGSLAQVINYCDAISPAHLIACLAGGAIMLPAIRWAPQSIAIRGGILALAGATALIILYYSAPQCVGGAFSNLDPLVRDYWLVNVNEGLPIWVQPWKTSITLLGGAILTGLLSFMFIITRRAQEFDRGKLFLLGYAFIWAFIVSLLVQRATSVAAAYAMPFMAWAAYQVFVYARQIKKPGPRILATVSVVFVIMPGPLATSVYNMVAANDEVPTSETGKDQPACDSIDSLERLNILPRSTLVAPFDFGPQILLQSPHRVLATSHHRNSTAMADQIRIFISSPETAQALIADRNIRYIATCPDEDEMQLYRIKHPSGLAAKLHSGNAPKWLQPVHIRHSDLTIWRVVPKELLNSN